METFKKEYTFNRENQNKTHNILGPLLSEILKEGKPVYGFEVVLNAQNNQWDVTIQYVDKDTPPKQAMSNSVKKKFTEIEETMSSLRKRDRGALGFSRRNKSKH